MKSIQVENLRSKTKKRRGVAAVEFALIAPVLIAILLGILEAAFLGRATLAVANGAREGARLASLGKTTSEIKARVRRVADVVAVTDEEITITVSSNNGSTFTAITADLGVANSVVAGNLVKISVNHPHRSLTGFFPFLRNYSDKADVVMRREAS